MQFRNLAVILPFALLAACGGSGTSEESPTATPETAAATEAPASAAAATTPSSEEIATPTAAASASAVPSASASAFPAATPAATASVAAAAPPPGFAVCRACHSVEQGKNGVGPSLFGIVDSKAGDVPNYAFSPALKASGIVWDRAKLDTWLQGPMNMVPGTKMVISVSDPASRKAIIDYLETLK